LREGRIGAGALRALLREGRIEAEPLGMIGVKTDERAA
jgi:hypothetical protein